MGAARVGCDQRVPRGALPRAAAPARRSRRRVPRRACASSATTTSPSPYYALRRREDGAEDGVRGRARRARRDARRRSVPDGRGVRSRRHRARAVGDPGARHARRLARAVPATERVARAPRRAAVGRGRDRDSSRPCERRRLATSSSAGSARTGSSCSTCARPASSAGAAGYPCDTARATCPAPATSISSSCSRPADAAAIRALVGAPEGTEVIAYCHSGGRSAMAAQLLRAAGYEARNYVGSWHEWSADPAAPDRVALSRPA